MTAHSKHPSSLRLDARWLVDAFRVTTRMHPAAIAAEIRRRHDRLTRSELRASVLVALAERTVDYFRALDRWELAAESDTELVAAAAALDAAEDALRSAVGLPSSMHAVRESPPTVAAIRAASVIDPLPWWRRIATWLRGAIRSRGGRGRRGNPQRTAALLEPLPDIVRCSRTGCTESLPSTRLPDGWVLVNGHWFCHRDVEAARRAAVADVTGLDGIDQREPEPSAAAELIDLDEMPTFVGPGGAQ